MLQATKSYISFPPISVSKINEILWQTCELEVVLVLWGCVEDFHVMLHYKAVMYAELYTLQAWRVLLYGDKEVQYGRKICGL